MNIYRQPFRTDVVPNQPIAGAETGLRLRGFEVVQAVQDLEHSVSLISEKTTLVRVYLDPGSLRAAATLRGELVWGRGGGESYLPSLNAVAVDPAADLSLQAQRVDLAHSLNFLLPSAAIAVGKTSLKLNRVSVPGAEDLRLAPDIAPREVEFVRPVIMRVRAVGLRYRDPASGQAITPDAVHFSYLRSFLQRAYPVTRIEWSQIVVEANFTAPFDDNTSTLANAQLAAMRSQEVSAGLDPRTHYYGLVDDNRGQNFLRGMAFTIPESPQPDVVACGPAGVPAGFAGDHDPSYADWYGAHELGHTLGRYHPGFPADQQDASDPDFPYPNGLISQGDGRFVGLDTGDTALGIGMSVLAGHTHHDLMTYGDQQWISEHTFEGIYRRLLEEELLVADDGGNV